MALISPALRGPTIARLQKLLEQCRHQMRQLDSEVDRFHLLLQQFYSSFPNQNRDLDPDTGKLAANIEYRDNLDTGNAPMTPFPPFFQAMSAAAADPHRYRQYEDPRPTPPLEAQVKSFLVRQGLVARQQAGSLGVVVGNGTVHLYDLLCRELIRHPGDVLLMPAVTYGWFIPQVHRARGRLVGLDMDEAGRVSPATLSQAIKTHNGQSFTTWKATLGERLRLYAAELAAAAPGEVRQPAAAEAAGLARSLSADDPPSEIDQAVRRLVRDKVVQGERACRLAGWDAYPPLPLPPRVAAFLHINPSLMGTAYGQDEVHELAEVLCGSQVAVIEDLAYHSICMPLGALGTFLREPCDCYCLLGLSKPLSVPNSRIGILVADASRTPALVAGVEDSVGHVSTIVQAGLLAALQADQADIDAFLDLAHYELNRSIVLACLEGVGSAAVAEGHRQRCATLIEHEAMELVAWKRARGSDVDEPSILAGIDLRDSREDPNGHAARAIHAFLDRGLRDWFRVVQYPQAGFFVVVSCLPLLQRSPLAGVKVESAFDTSALLEFLLGVRTLPAELLGVSTDSGEPFLRLSFSCSIQTIVRALFTTCIGLNQLSVL